MDVLLYSFIFLLSQIFFGIYFLFKLNKGFYLQDIRVFFVLTFALYSLFLPAVSLVGLISEFDNDVLAQTTNQYALALLAFNIVNLQFRQRWNNNVGIIKNVRYLDLNVHFLLCLVLFSIFYMKRAGVNIFQFGDGMSTRTEIGESISQVWILLSFLIIVLTNYLIYNFDKLSKFHKLELLFLLCVYAVFQFSLGNRREIAGIVFFSISFLMVKYRMKLNLSITLILLVLFFLSFYITIFRNENARSLDPNAAVELATVSNEFVYPIQTTYHIIEDKWDLRYGTTYLFLPFQVLVPRVIYPDKPNTLGAEFVNKTFGEGFQGFAYTPVSEAYLNFGRAGSFIVFYIFSCLLNYLIRKNSVNVHFTYFLFYGLIFDFCRGDFSSLFYAYFVMYYVGYKFFLFLSKYRLKYRR